MLKSCAPSPRPDRPAGGRLIHCRYANGTVESRVGVGLKFL